MTDSAQRSRRLGRSGIAPPLLLAAVLVAASVLFVQAWNSLDERRTSSERERQGIEYLRSLHPVATALMDMQVATVAGQTPSRDALNQAVEAATSIDARLGDALRTRERWTGVRAKLEALPEQGLARPARDIYNAYSETAALLLALYNKVRESSGLIRDPDADAYHLQDSTGEELPEALVAAGRLASLARLATTRSPDDQVRTAVELSAARSAVQEPAEDLVEGLQAAVDGTRSRQLSGSLLQHLDAYQQAVEALLAASATTGPTGPDPAQVEAARKAMQEATNALADVSLTELDALVATRLDGLVGQRRLTAATAAAGLLLGLALLYLLLAPRRQRRSPIAEPAADTEPAALSSGSGSASTSRETTREPAHELDREPARKPGDEPDSWRQGRSWTERAPFDFGPTAAHAPAAVPVSASHRGATTRGTAAHETTTHGTTAHGTATHGTAASADPGPRTERPAQWGRSDAAR